MRATGLADGDYEFGGLTITVKDKTARTQDGALAGSTSTLFECVKCAIVNTNFNAVSETKSSEKAIYRHICFKAEPGKEYSTEKIAEITTSEDDFEPQGDITDITYTELNIQTEWQSLCLIRRSNS